ncbi:MAG TPA: Na/Pi cotransporter family protein [Candidatus Pelethocola excrementipullorum]|nr:Na/Pi cotransporter family protein [Candidatus Pelethocola excrementipullorum]
MRQYMKMIIGLLGGLALFLYGMNMMSENLQKAAGERMKHVLAIMTSNPLMGVLAGVLTSAVLQSSGAITVMVIGFVGAGLMTLPQAISVIMGANVGTTITAQLLAFQLSDYIWGIVFLGFVIYFFAEKEQGRYIGQAILGFGLLFIGIDAMENAMSPLASGPIFAHLIEKVSDVPVLGLVMGTLMTLVVQSSSATIAVLQNLASQTGVDGVTSIIGLAGAIPIMLGDNIGTTITALLASIGQSTNAKRTAVAHSVLNVSGSLLFLWAAPWFAEFIKWISPKGPESEVISRQIANAHTVFNVLSTILWLPFIWLMVRIVTWMVPGGTKDMEDSVLDSDGSHQRI